MILLIALSCDDKGIELCNLVSQLVGVPADSVTIPDGPALSSSPYYENITNFLSAVAERGLPTFEGSDLEQVKLSRNENHLQIFKI